MYFPTKYLRVYPQNHPKTPLWGPYNAKPRRTLMELRRWNFHSLSPEQTTAKNCKSKLQIYRTIYMT